MRGDVTAAAERARRRRAEARTATAVAGRRGGHAGIRRPERRLRARRNGCGRRGSARVEAAAAVEAVRGSGANRSASARCSRGRRSGEGASAIETAVTLRRRDDGVFAEAQLIGLRTRARYGRMSRDALALRIDGRLRSDPLGGRRVFHRASVVDLRGGTGHDVRAKASATTIEEVVVVAVRVVIVVVIEAERPTDGVPVVPVVIRRRGRPADVVIAGAITPGDPRTGVTATRNPHPTVVRKNDPATVVIRRPTPRVVGDPDVVGVVRIGPVTGRHVRLKIRADFRRARDPNRSIRRVVDPRTVPFEGRFELRQRARIRVLVFVGLRIVFADRDLLAFLQLGMRGLIGGELLRGHRSRRRLRVLVLRNFGLGLVRTAADRPQREQRRPNRGRPGLQAKEHRHLQPIATATPRETPTARG